MLFDSTLRRDLSRNFGATLVVLLTVVLTIMFIRTLGQAAVGRVSPQDVMLLLGYIGLGYLPTMLAASLFIAVVATLTRMYRASEMTIWFASGVSLIRFLRPVLVTTWPVLLLIALLVLFAWPWQNAQVAQLRERFERRSDLSRVAPGQFQTSGDGQRTFFFEGSASDATQGRNVLVVTGKGDVEAVTTARSGRLVTDGEGRWVVLDAGQRNEQDTKTGEKTLSRFDAYRAQAPERVLAPSRGPAPRAKPTAELIADATPANRGELTWRLGLVLASAILLLLGVGMSAANPRHASNWNLLFALLGFFAYLNVVNLSQAWVASGRLSTGTALAVAHGGALLLAVWLLWYRLHATTRGVVPRRRRRRKRASAAAAARPA